MKDWFVGMSKWQLDNRWYHNVVVKLEKWKQMMHESLADVAE